MAILHDTSTRFPATAGAVDITSGDRTFTHTPIGTPKGVVVVGCVDSGSTEPFTGVLYGGTAMVKSSVAHDTSEAGTTVVYTLTDQTIPTGAQTVTLQSCTGNNKFVTCSTVTATAATTTVNTSGNLDTTIAADPQITLTTTASTISYGGVNTGAAAPVTTVLTGCTHLHDADYGQRSAMTLRRTNADAAGSVTIGYTLASEDFCIAAVALAETAAGDITTSPLGVPSSARIGDSDVIPIASPNAVVSVGSFGDTKVGAAAIAASVDSAQRIGSASVSQIGAQSGIDSGQSVGNANISQTLAPVGIGSAQTVGAQQAGFSINASGIDTQERLGVIVSTQVVALNSIQSAETHGVSSTGQTSLIAATGIPSSERTGVSTNTAIGTTVAYNTFNTGTGNITVANSALNGTAFTSVTGSPAGNTFTYDGTGQALVTLGVTAGEAYGTWDSTVLGTQVQRFIRLDPTFTSVSPGGSIRLVRLLSGTTLRSVAQLSTTGRLQILNSAGTTIATGTIAVPTSQKIRVELRVVGDATVGEVELRWWSDWTSTGPPTEVLHAVNANTGGAIDQIRAGHSGVQQSNFTYTFDTLTVSNNGWTAELVSFVNPAGITSAEQFGSSSFIQDQFISAASIPTAEIVGISSVAVDQLVVATGIATSGQTNSVTVTQPTATIEIGAIRWVTVAASPQTVSPKGIGSAEKVGFASAAAAQIISASSIPSGEQAGSIAASFFNGIISTGIESKETAGTVTVTPGTTTLLVAGITTAELVGTTSAVIAPTQTITATGISSVGTAGTIAASLSIVPAGIGSSEALGLATAVPGAITIAATGISSQEASGTTLISTAPGQTIAAGSIQTQEYAGAIQISSAATISATGIVSGQALDNVALTSAYTIASNGIASEGRLGAASSLVTVVATGIPTNETLGALVATPGAVSVVGTSISSSESFGTAPVAIAAAQSISATGITSSQTLGQAQAAQSIAGSGIQSQERLGGTSTSPGTVTLSIAGISSTQSFGDTQLAVSYSISAKSIAPTDNLGKISLTIGIAATAIASSESIGKSNVVPAAVTINAIGIATAQGFGLVIVEVLTEGARIALTAAYIGYHGTTFYQRRYKGYVLEHEILAAATEPLEV